MEKKYEFTDETIKYDGHTLHRIRALRDFGDVKAGSRGGYVESEDNLDHGGICWVRRFAKVFDNARVCGDAQVYGRALVYDNARVSSYAMVGGTAQVCGDARIHGNARVCGNLLISDRASVSSNARGAAC